MLIQKRGTVKIKWFPKVASTVFELGDAVSFNTLGTITRSTSGSTTVAGFIKRAVTASDTDYASASLVPVQVVEDNDEIEIDASTTVTAAMIGTLRDLSNSSTLNVGSLFTIGHFRVLGIGSTTSKAVVALTKSAIAQ